MGWRGEGQREREREKQRKITCRSGTGYVRNNFVYRFLEELAKKSRMNIP